MAYNLNLFIVIIINLLLFQTVISKKIFSKDELSKYNGKDVSFNLFFFKDFLNIKSFFSKKSSVPIYIAIKGVVFDVSTGRGK